MQDLFERVREYYYQERGRGWEMNWEPYQEYQDGWWTVISPKNQSDRRRLYVAPFLYDEKGVMDADEALRLLEEKRAYMEKIQNLGRTAAYTCRVDYAAVKELVDVAVIGFDILLLHDPMVSVPDFLRWNADAARRSEQLLYGTTHEAEKNRNMVGIKLARHLALALQEVYCAGLSHGHINPEHILVEADGTGEDFKLSIPGEDALFRSAAEEQRTMDYYTAPERIANGNHPVDMQTDLYSVGLLLYQLLNEGKLPFEGNGVSKEEAVYIRNSGNREIPPPKNGSQLMKYIAAKAYAYNRKARYQNTTELMIDLSHAEQQLQAQSVNLNKAAAAGAAFTGAGVYQNPAPNPGVRAYQNTAPNPGVRMAEGSAAPAAKKKFNPVWLILPILLMIFIAIVLLIGTIFMISRLGSGDGNSGMSAAYSSTTTSRMDVPATTEAPTAPPTQAPTEPPTAPPTEPPTTEPPYVPPTYIIVQGKYTWEEAQAECKARGGHLATIHSNEEWQMLMEAVNNAQLSNSDLKYLWMGGLSELKERPNGEIYAEFKWVDDSDVSYITDKTRFGHWFYNAELDIYEPSGYDAYEYLKNNKMIAEPYLLLWNVAAKKGADLKWSLNDVGDVSPYSQYKSSNMGFVMELD